LLRLFATSREISVCTRLHAFEGSSVHYWATPLEGRLCANQEIALVGAGNSAGQAAVYLASQSAKVWMLVRGADIGASMSRYLVDRIEGQANIEVLTRAQVSGLEGRDGILEAVRWRKAISSVPKLANRTPFAIVVAAR
jgi:thioredoxin reductase (NADPH)